MNRKPTQISPSKIIYEEGSANPLWLDTLITQWRNFLEWIRALIVVSLLIVIPVAIGIYTYRIINLNLLTFEQVMIAVFRSTAPDQNVIWLAFLSGLIILIINIKNILSKESAESASGATRFFGAVVTILWLDFYWLNISPFRLWIGIEEIVVNKNIEILVAQAVTFVLTLLILPLTAKIVHVRIGQLNIKINQIVISIFNWSRFLLAIGFIFVYLVYIIGIGVPENLLSAVPVSVFPFPVSWMGLRTLDATVFLVILAVAALFYRPPEFRKMSTFGIARMLIFLFAFLSCGWIFQQLPNIRGYVDILSVSAIFAVSAIPVQRWLS